MKRLFVKTYGCQMNFYDSSRMKDLLLVQGSVLVEDVNDADIVLYNTCHIREKAAERVYSELSKIKQLKAKKLLPLKKPLVKLLKRFLQKLVRTKRARRAVTLRNLLKRAHLKQLEVKKRQAH